MRRNNPSEATQIVAPLPPPEKHGLPLVIIEPGLAEAPPIPWVTRHRKWIVRGAMGGAALLAVILFAVIGFSDDGVKRQPSPDHQPAAARSSEVKPRPPAPPSPSPEPERAVQVEPPPDPPPTTEAALPVPAPPPPAEVQAPSPPVTPPSEAPPPSPPSPPQTKVGPSRSPSVTHRPAPAGKPAPRSPGKPAKPARSPTYDPNSLFLKKP